MFKTLYSVCCGDWTGLHSSTGKNTLLLRNSLTLFHCYHTSCSIISTIQWSRFSGKWHQYFYQVVKMCGILESWRAASDIINTTRVWVQPNNEAKHWSMRLSGHYSFGKCLNKNKKYWLIISKESNLKRRPTPKGLRGGICDERAKWYYESYHYSSTTCCKFHL